MFNKKLYLVILILVVGLSACGAVPESVQIDLSEVVQEAAPAVEQAQVPQQVEEAPQGLPEDGQAPQGQAPDGQAPDGQGPQGQALDGQQGDLVVAVGAQVVAEVDLHDRDHVVLGSVGGHDDLVGALL